MAQTRYRAMLVDVDGTMALPDMRVSDRVAGAVGRLNERLTVGIISSRDHHDVGSLAARLGLDGLHVAEGGARIFDSKSGRAVWSKAISPAAARDIVAFLEGSRLPFSAVDDGVRHESSAGLASWQITRITATSLTEERARRIAVEYGETAGLHTAVIKRIDNEDWMVDFTHADATKATAVRRYAAATGAEPSQIIGAGDSYNDLPLLQACGLRIAMGNAAPEVKAAADYVAPTVDDDGLAVAIEEFVLPRL